LSASAGLPMRSGIEKRPGVAGPGLSTEGCSRSPAGSDGAGRDKVGLVAFVRHFKAATGTTPHAWLRTQRMNRAEELLETTDLPIEQVAEQVDCL
jgi:hypothetical protein